VFVGVSDLMSLQNNQRIYWNEPSQTINIQYYCFYQRRRPVFPFLSITAAGEQFLDI
jgi:hypothetical protein